MSDTLFDTDQDGFPLIGPHNERELELMLAGRKPMAMFIVDDGTPPEYCGSAFEPYVESGVFLKFETPSDIPGTKFVWYTQPDEAWCGKLAAFIHMKLMDGEARDVLNSRDLYTIDGHLLGCSKECIQHFLRLNT